VTPAELRQREVRHTVACLVTAVLIIPLLIHGLGGDFTEGWLPQWLVMASMFLSLAGAVTCMTLGGKNINEVAYGEPPSMSDKARPYHKLHVFFWQNWPHTLVAFWAIAINSLADFSGSLFVLTVNVALALLVGFVWSMYWFQRRRLLAIMEAGNQGD